MNTAIIFEPEEKLSSRTNLDNFIAMCREELTVFGADLAFDKHIWDISSYIEQKATKKRIAAIFSTKDFTSTHRSGKSTEENINPISEPFLNFAKAYFRYKFGLNAFRSPGQLLDPLRVLEQALIHVQGKADPTMIDNYVLDEAIIITKAYYSQSRGYRIGNTLQNIGIFLANKHLTKVAPDWKNPIKRPADSIRIGKEADNRRNRKMPSKAGLEALPEIFNKAITSHDRLASALIALLVCAPNRINEVFLLPYNCEIVKKDKEGIEQYGLRWFPAKGAAPMIKWIIPSMVGVAKEAIKKIKNVTEQARGVAQWYNSNPNKLYLSKELEYLRNKHLGTTEVSYILFGKNITDMHLKQRKQLAISWMKNHSIPSRKEGHNLTIHFTDLEKSLLLLLPKKFPYLNKEIGLKFSDALLLQMTNEYHSVKGTLIPTVNAVSMGLVSDALKSRGNMSSLFDRFGYTEKNGSKIKMTSHQFRHYLNTLAQRGGVSQLDIAKWSGRIDIHQNQAYDHMSTNEMLEMVRNAVGDETMMKGPLSNIEDIQKKVIISRDAFARLKIRTAHTTEFGLCIHDFTMSPCQLYRNCMVCTEHFCIKGDMRKTENIKQRKKETKLLLEHAKNAHQEGYFGADRWIESHRSDLEILTHTCDILDNLDIPDGTVIQLSNIHSVSPIEHADKRRDDHGEIAYEKDNFDLSYLNKTKQLLEDMGEEK